MKCADTSIDFKKVTKWGGRGCFVRKPTLKRRICETRCFISFFFLAHASLLFTAVHLLLIGAEECASSLAAARPEALNVSQGGPFTQRRYVYLRTIP